MRVIQYLRLREIAFLLTTTMLAACGVLPGFGVLDNPTLYLLPVGRVANQVACELQEFVVEHQNTEVTRRHRWQLADEDVNVKLMLTTDTKGNVNFTGVNLAKLGFETVASFITTQNTAPSLGIRVIGDRSKTVTVSFSVSPHPLPLSKKRAQFRDPKTNEP